MRHVRFEHEPDHDQRKHAQRHVDVEDPAPRKMLDDKPAQQRSDDRRQSEHAAEQALVTAAFGGRNDVGNGGHGHDHQTAAAEPLQRAQHDQLGHVLRDAAQDGAGKKNEDRRLNDDFAAEQIAEFAVQRHDDSRRQQVGRHDPRQAFEPAQFAHDGWQRGGNDGLVERAEQHDEQQRREEQPDWRSLRGGGKCDRGLQGSHSAAR